MSSAVSVLHGSGRRMLRQLRHERRGSAFTSALEPPRAMANHPRAGLTVSLLLAILVALCFARVHEAPPRYVGFAYNAYCMFVSGLMAYSLWQLEAGRLLDEADPWFVSLAMWAVASLALGVTTAVGPPTLLSLTDSRLYTPMSSVTAILYQLAALVALLLPAFLLYRQQEFKRKVEEVMASHSVIRLARTPRAKAASRVAATDTVIAEPAVDAESGGADAVGDEAEGDGGAAADGGDEGDGGFGSAADGKEEEAVEGKAAIASDSAAAEIALHDRLASTVDSVKAEEEVVPPVAALPPLSLYDSAAAEGDAASSISSPLTDRLPPSPVARRRSSTSPVMQPVGKMAPLPQAAVPADASPVVPPAASDTSTIVRHYSSTVHTESALSSLHSRIEERKRFGIKSWTMGLALAFTVISLLNVVLLRMGLPDVGLALFGMLGLSYLGAIIHRSGEAVLDNTRCIGYGVCLTALVLSLGALLSALLYLLMLAFRREPLRNVLVLLLFGPILFFTRYVVEHMAHCFFSDRSRSEMFSFVADLYVDLWGDMAFLGSTLGSASFFLMLFLTITKQLLRNTPLGDELFLTCRRWISNGRVPTTAEKLAILARRWRPIEQMQMSKLLTAFTMPVILILDPSLPFGVKVVTAPLSTAALVDETIIFIILLLLQILLDMFNRYLTDRYTRKLLLQAHMEATPLPTLFQAGLPLLRVADRQHWAEHLWVLFVTLLFVSCDSVTFIAELQKNLSFIGVL